MTRLDHVRRLYEIIAELERSLGGKHILRDCHGRLDWPVRGVYFFFEDGEERTDSGPGPRIVRVGTHALTENARTKLWSRLSQHRGVARTGGGNHRGSIFRLLVGTAIKGRRGDSEPRSWGIGGDPTRAAAALKISRTAILEGERKLEADVTQWICSMPFLFVAVEDVPGGTSHRATIERNAIALLSNYDRPSIDRLSEMWLGRYCDRPRVRESGLWNSNHVDEKHDPRFLELLAKYAGETRPPGKS
jgi:hypothetical protein